MDSGLFEEPTQGGYINMVGYQPFCPYKVDLDFYKDARRQFSTEDWLDIIIGGLLTTIRMVMRRRDKSSISFVDCFLSLRDG